MNKYTCNVSALIFPSALQKNKKIKTKIVLKAQISIQISKTAYNKNCLET